ncbi:MAG: glutamyl-tRNA amidotransferase [Gammaproteobacteria bacterium RBG_16_51_14]|nr:MAG: glutamyl-tRNA amidotransferase [Gammaproteobacteria bacterium RBG_16_51_14]
MADLKARITEDSKTAMRSRDKDRLSVLRMILAAIKQVEVDERITLDDARTLAVLEKKAKQHRDSIEQFQAAGRDDLVSKETFELGIVQEYMPAPLGEAEINQLIASAIRESGAATIKDMGKIMALLKPKVQGRTDMGKLSNLVKQQLG